MKIKKSLGEIIFDSVNYIILAILMIITVYPFWFIIVASISDPVAVMKKGTFMLLPEGFQVHAYQYVLSNKMVLMGYRNTLVYVIFGTLVSIIFTTMGAFALSRKSIFGRKYIMLFLIITMFFNGGMIPTYILMSKLHLINNMLVLIIPGSLSVYNLIVMRTSFESIPESLIESAKIEGANDFKILWSIVIPTSKAIVAVMLLFFGVQHWNVFFNALIYITNRNLYPLQLVLRDILLANDTESMTIGSDVGNASLAISESIKYATIIVATLPIMLVYPFIQKYFVQGVMIGAIKE